MFLLPFRAINRGYASVEESMIALYSEMRSGMNHQPDLGQNPREAFDAVVNSYDVSRPEYPAGLFSDILNFASFSSGKKAVEIGAGTGKATLPFLHAGYDVTAIELGANMANFLSTKFGEYKNFNVVVDSFEDAALEENHYDLLYAATAFHWVNAEIGCPKAFHLLTQSGTIALFRYNVVAADGEKAYDEIQSIYERYYYSHYATNKRPVKKTTQDYLKPSEIKASFGFESLNDYGFSDVSMTFYNGSKTFTADEYIVNLNTISDHIGLPERNRAALYHEIRKTIIKHGDCHKVDYLYQLYMGRKFV